MLSLAIRISVTVFSAKFDTNPILMYTKNMDYTARLDTLTPLILQVKDWSKRNDMLKLHKNMRILADKISQEAVNCRRLHKPTATFVALDTQFNEQYSELEQWLTFALLL